MGRRDSPLSAQCRWEGHRAVVTVCGEVDFATADTLAQCLEDVVCRGPEHVVIDLARTSFLDAAGLRVISWARQKLAHDCPLVLRAPTRQVRMALEIGGLTRQCPIEDSGRPDARA